MLVIKAISILVACLGTAFIFVFRETLDASFDAVGECRRWAG